MTTYILAGVIVIRLIASAIIVFAWRIAVYDANQADDFILAPADNAVDFGDYVELRADHAVDFGDYVELRADHATLLRDEAENIRQWRGEVQGND